MSDTPTVNAVVKEAKRLREQGEREKQANPWAKPYMPTEAGARKLSVRYGPERALELLHEKAAMANRAHREQEERARDSQDKHNGRHKRFQQDRDKRREQDTPGVRIDRALRELRNVSTVAAQRFKDDSEISRSAEQTATLPRAGDEEYRKALRTAVWVARELERVADDAHRRRVADGPDAPRVTEMSRFDARRELGLDGRAA